MNSSPASELALIHGARLRVFCPACRLFHSWGATDAFFADEPERAGDPLRRT